MLPFIAAAGIGAAAQLYGQHMANEQNAAATAATNRLSAREAEKNRAFQAWMSNTSYQRATDDMRKANINPMLTYMQGGASTPGGSQASFQTPTFTDPIGKAASSAIDTYQRGQQLAQGLEGIGVQKGQLKVAEANSQADIALKAAQAAATAASAKQTEASTQMLMHKIKKEKLEGDFYGSDAGKTFFNLQKINEAAGGSLDTLNNAKDLLNPMKFMPKTPKKLQQKLNKKTGEIELYGY